MLTLDNVSRSIGSFALSQITFSVARGDYVIILGPTACGKTILLETIAGIGRAEQGRIFIDGRDVSAVPPERRNIGFVYQRSMLFPNYTVAGNIAYGMKLRKLPADEQKKRIGKLAEMLGITDLLEREVKNLSGGESQKVALARALAIEPPILLLDEPLAPLDPPTREALRKEILKMHRHLGTTILHVTHDQVTARVLGDKIGVMQEGRIRQFGLAGEIFDRPNSDFVARFVGMENVYEGHAAPAPGGCIVKVGEMALKSKCTLRGGVGLCVGPEAIHLAQPGRQFANVLAGKVRDVSDRGSIFKLTIDVQGLPFIVHVSRGEYEAKPLAGGADVALGFDPEKVHCFELNRE